MLDEVPFTRIFFTEITFYKIVNFINIDIVFIEHNDYYIRLSCSHLLVTCRNLVGWFKTQI
jgi:hypothetical protein